MYSPTESSAPTGYACNHHPQRKRRTLLFKHQAQDLTSRHPSRIYFPRQKTYIHKHHIFIHYSMHIRIMNVQSHLFWEHHACHTSWHRIQLTFCLFRTKVNTKIITINSRDSRSDSCILPGCICKRSLVDSTPVSSQGISTWRNSGLDSCIQPGHVWRVWRFDSCIQPGHICWRLIPDSIPVSCQGTSEEFEDPIPVSCQGVSVDD